MAPNHGGDHLGSTLWPMGSHWVQKWVTTVKKNTMPPNSNFRLPRGHRFRPKFDFTVMARNHSGDSLGRSHRDLGPNSNFRLPRGLQFRPKFDFTVMAQNHGVDHLGSTLWPMGSHWVQRMGQNRKKLPCPQIRLCDYDFDQNSTLR